MPQISRKALFIAFVAATLTIAAIAQNRDEHHEEHKPKNLTVLSKDISHDSLMSLMREYSVSLGVHCNFCHNKAADGSDHMDFASDDNKHKKIARYMIKMTAGINQQYFQEENGGEHRHTALMVSCFTCHHGQKEPQAFVMPAQEERH